MAHRYGTGALALLVATFSLAHAVGTFSQLDESRLQQTISAYMGTPYQYGGTSRNGIDCSGFVLAVYREQGLNLPRSAADQYRVGEPVPRERLEPGDLVFFNTTGRGVSHVGVVKEPGVFAHASSSRGVTTDQLSDSYWNSRYVGARRLATTSTFLVADTDAASAAAATGTASAAATGITGRPAAMVNATVLTNDYPFNAFELIDVPTNQVGAPRAMSMQFSTARDGRVSINPQISLWQRLQLAAFFPIDDALGSGTPKPDWPEFLVKVRFMDQWKHIPGFAVGYDFRKSTVERETNYVDSTNVSERRRGLFLVGSGALGYDRSRFIGKTLFHAGASLHTFKDVSFSEDVSGFVGVEQQLLRRVTLLAEVDNIYGPGGWYANVGARVTITEGAVLEYDITHLRSTDVATNRLLKFNFSVPF